MPVQAFISISYEAASKEAVEEFVNGMTLPEGAAVSANVNEIVMAGVVQGGVIEIPSTELPPPPPAEEPPVEEPAAEPPPEEPAP